MFPKASDRPCVATITNEELVPSFVISKDWVRNCEDPIAVYCCFFLPAA